MSSRSKSRRNPVDAQIALCLRHWADTFQPPIHGRNVLLNSARRDLLRENPIGSLARSAVEGLLWILGLLFSEWTYSEVPVKYAMREMAWVRLERVRSRSSLWVQNESTGTYSLWAGLFCLIT